MKKNLKGQAAILIIFVFGMVSLLIGISLVKTGFAESIMGRSTADSTQAFYAANSGVEDAIYKIQQSDFDYSESVPDLVVGESTAKVTITEGGNCESDEVEIESIGRYKNFIRKIRVCTFNASTEKGLFDYAIQAGNGGVELENTTIVTGRNKDTGEVVPGNVYSKEYIRGENNGKELDCSKPASVTRINGNAWALGNIEGLDDKNGPCIDGNAYAGGILACRVLGSAYSTTTIDDCSYASICDPLIDPTECKIPDIDLPDLELEKMKNYLQEKTIPFTGDCEVGGVNDCSIIRPDGKRSLGNILITGNLTAKEDFFVSGPIWVQGDIEINSNLEISLIPEITDISQIILASGRIVTTSNVVFIPVGHAFLLFASESPNIIPNVCANEDGDDPPAIEIRANVDSIMFYATKGCVSMRPTAKRELYGTLLGEGIRINTNSQVTFNPALQFAEFALIKEGGWQISSFTEL